MTPAQDPNQPLGKILRLTLDGKPAPGNPMAGKIGAASVPVIDPPADTVAAKTAPVVRTYTFPGPNLTPSETWASGFRTPYGLAFAPDGRLWELEHGPRGGDELNLIEPGKNYGWPLVSYGHNYNGVPIPSPDTRPDLTKPVIYWVPVLAPGNLMFYKGAMFPQWNGSAFASGLSTNALVRITFDGKGGAQTAERWDVGHRVRDVEVAPDGALWMIEDAQPGGLFRLTPLGMAVSAPVAQPATPASAPSGSATLNASNVEHVKSVIANNNCLVLPSHRTRRGGHRTVVERSGNAAHGGPDTSGDCQSPFKNQRRHSQPYAFLRKKNRGRRLKEPGALSQHTSPSTLRALVSERTSEAMIGSSKFVLASLLLNRSGLQVSMNSDGPAPVPTQGDRK